MSKGKQVSLTAVVAALYMLIAGIGAANSPVCAANVYHVHTAQAGLNHATLCTTHFNPSARHSIFASTPAAAMQALTPSINTATSAAVQSLITPSVNASALNTLMNSTSTGSSGSASASSGSVTITTSTGSTTIPLTGSVTLTLTSSQGTNSTTLNGSENLVISSPDATFTQNGGQIIVNLGSQSPLSINYAFGGAGTTLNGSQITNAPGSINLSTTSIPNSIFVTGIPADIGGASLNLTPPPNTGTISLCLACAQSGIANISYGGSQIAPNLSASWASAGVFIVAQAVALNPSNSFSGGTTALSTGQIQSTLPSVNVAIAPVFVNNIDVKSLVLGTANTFQNTVPSHFSPISYKSDEPLPRAYPGALIVDTGETCP